MAKAFITIRKRQQHHDRRRRPLGERALRAVGPDVDLHREGCGRREGRGRHVDDERLHADHQQGCGLAQGVGHADDGAGQDAGQRQRQDMVGHGLQLGGADAERRLADRRRHRAQGGAGGDHDRRQHQQRQRQAADQRRGARQVEGVEEHGEAQEAEHDRGHGGQIVDVDLDQVGEAVLGRELLEIEGGRDAGGHAQAPA